MNKKIIVTVSGGKDSQATLKLAVEQHGSENVSGIYADTGWEHPITYAHIKQMENLYGVEIRTIRRIRKDGVVETVENLQYRYKYWPSMKARFCTGRCKMKPMNQELIRYCRETPEPVEAWCGVRRAESPAREKRYRYSASTETYTPSDVAEHFRPALDKTGCLMRMPIVEWSGQEVMSYLEGQENPLYRAGFNRVGCFPCLAAGDASKIQCFDFDDFGRGQYAKVQAVEEYRKTVGAKERNCRIMQTKYGLAWAAGDKEPSRRWLERHVAKADALYADPELGGAGCSFCAM